MTALDEHLRHQGDEIRPVQILTFDLRDLRHQQGSLQTVAAISHLLIRADLDRLANEGVGISPGGDAFTPASGQ